MSALRIARAVTNRNRIALFSGSYHGTFDGTLARPMAVNGNPGSIPLAPGVLPHMIEDVMVLDYGNPESLDILRAHGDDLAAVLVEPVQSRRPDLQPIDFLHDLRQLTSETGTALIFDEVITGFRIHPGGVQALFGIRADLAIYGKAVGAGMPIGVVAGKASYMDAIDGGMWNYGDESYPQANMTLFAGTYFKHPLVMASAWAALNYMRDGGAELQQQLSRRTSEMVGILNGHFEYENVPIRIKHFGSLFRFFFPPELPFVELLYYHLLQRGVYVGETRNCFLSTAHTQEDIDYLIEAVKESVAELREGGILPGGPDTSLNATEPLTRPVEQAAEKSIESATGPKEVLNVPLTEGQRQLWVLAQMGNDASGAYNESMTLRLRGRLDVTAIRKSLQQVVDRHDALRTTFDPKGELPGYFSPCGHRPASHRFFKPP